MRTKETYICDYCFHEYNTKEAAETCEKNHKHIKKAIPESYLPLKNDGTGRPASVKIVFDDDTYDIYYL